MGYCQNWTVVLFVPYPPDINNQEDALGAFNKNRLQHMLLSGFYFVNSTYAILFGNEIYY
jgi:hypothetical protein